MIVNQNLYLNDHFYSVIDAYYKIYEYNNIILIVRIYLMNKYILSKINSAL